MSKRNAPAPVDQAGEAASIDPRDIPKGTPPGGGRWTWDRDAGEAGDWKSLDEKPAEQPEQE